MEREDSDVSGQVRFTVGDRVRVVDDSHVESESITRGSVYTVESIYVIGTAQKLVLAEKTRAHPVVAYDHRRFVRCD